MQATLSSDLRDEKVMVDQTPPETMKIDERLDQIAGLMHLATARLKEKAGQAGYKRFSEYLAILEKRRRRNPYE